MAFLFYRGHSSFFIAGIAALAQDSIIPWHEEEKVEDVLRETILWRSLVLDFKINWQKAPQIKP